MNAKILDGESIFPNNFVLVRVQPLRIWGNQYRENEKAEAIYAKGMVFRITFEKNEQSELVWTAEVCVSQPLCKPDGTVVNYTSRIVDLPPQNILRLLNSAEIEEFQRETSLL